MPTIAGTCNKEGCHGCGKREGCNDKPPPPPQPPPLPALPPWDADITPNTLNIYARWGSVWANGKRLHIKGVNWFGSEGRSGPPLGLDKHQIDWYMSFLQEHKFNAIRFLVRHLRASTPRSFAHLRAASKSSVFARPVRGSSTIRASSMTPRSRRPTRPGTARVRLGRRQSSRRSNTSTCS